MKKYELTELDIEVLIGGSSVLRSGTASAKISYADGGSACRVCSKNRHRGIGPFKWKKDTSGRGYSIHETSARGAFQSV